MEDLNQQCSDFTPREKELNNQIMKKIMMIRENYHELTKYLSEMPITIPCHETPEIREKQLVEYLESLNELVKNYHKENGGQSKLYEQE